MNAEPKKAAEQPRPSLRKALKGAPPVSYTHLDVYKRQVPRLMPAR